MFGRQSFRFSLPLQNFSMESKLQHLDLQCRWILACQWSPKILYGFETLQLFYIGSYLNLTPICFYFREILKCDLKGSCWPWLYQRIDYSCACLKVNNENNVFNHFGRFDFGHHSLRKLLLRKQSPDFFVSVIILAGAAGWAVHRLSRCHALRLPPPCSLNFWHI